MTAILGISAFYHDSAVALVVDGEVVAAAQEERFSRLKHDSSFPSQALAYCLREAGLSPQQIDYVGFYDKPLLKFERLIDTYVTYAPRGFRSFAKAVPVWIREKLFLSYALNKGLNGAYKKRYVFTEHHESHAASAFFPSPFEHAAVLTWDGVGEWATATFGTGAGNRFELTHELCFPHSLGLLYSAFTYFAGFKVNSGEYKLMGLAPYGTPRFRDQILERLIDLKPDGSFRMEMGYFDYCDGLRMTSQKFEELFEGPPRRAEGPVTQREMDLAASIQSVTEEIVLRTGRHVHEVTGARNLCLAGGVALNCVANGRLVREGPFDRVWIQPAAGDAGAALGVALFIWHQLLGNERIAMPHDSQRGSLLGPRASVDEIRSLLDSMGAVFHEYETDDALCEAVAELIAAENVIGWFQDRMEFGPRALGARSIIGDARSPRMQSVMNLKIKFRESFRPFAPSVLADRASAYFDLPDGQESPYMLLVAPVRESVRLPSAGGAAPPRGFERLNEQRSQIPAVTHVDYSARVQTVVPERNARFARLIAAFERKTGCSVVINTSFNVRGEPIVCRPEEAYRCFLATDMDVLVLERCVLLKREQRNMPPVQREDYLAQFDLD